MMAVGDTHDCVSWLSYNSINTTLFLKLLTTFLTRFSRGERQKYTGKKGRLTEYPTHNHQVMSLTHSPLSHQGGTVTRMKKTMEHEGHEGPVLLHWLIRKIPSYPNITILGNWFKT